jgi:hypothetical protein
MGAEPERQELAEVAAILETWADAIRSDTAPEENAGRAARNGRMADVLMKAVAALRAEGADGALFEAIRRASLIDADGVPDGYGLAQVYTDGEEVVVCGRPGQSGPEHDCARMGCGPTAHVILRMRARRDAAAEE